MRTTSIDNFKSGNHKYILSSGNKAADIEIVTTRKAKPEFDVHREIANRTFIRPLPPKGHILKANILSAPRIFVDDLLTDVKALKAAWKGDANDHQLGKLNDLGMKIGGLAIASYLFTKRPTPVSKAMEFVGLASFFASMAVWPKLALDIPARLIHGFSPFMRYEDSQGRKKRFFQDNQYIPFDMLSDKDINRIGNRLRIPKNQNNRREAVEERMRQIALQNNTMWMLTAGFATPIMSALICNVAEPYVERLYNSYMNGKVDNIMENFANESKKFKTKEISKKIEDLITLNKDKPVTKEVISDISKALTTHLGPNIRLGVEKDLTELLSNDKYIVAESQIKPLATRIEAILTLTANGKLLPQTIKAVIPTEAEITAAFSSKGYLSRPLSELEIQEAVRELTILVAQKIKTTNDAEGNTIKQNLQHKLITSLGKAAPDKAKSIDEILKTRSAIVLDSAAQDKIREIARVFTNVSAEHTALNVFAYHKLAQAPNTAKAKYWNESVNAIIKALNISQKEIDMTNYDRKLVGELLNQKTWEFATADSAEYTKFIKKLAAEISKIDINVKPAEFEGKFISQAKTTYRTAAETLRAKGFKYSAQRFIRNDGRDAGTLFGITKHFIHANLNNLSATFSAIINKANVYRTIFKDPNLSFIDGSNLSKEVKEELVALLEYLTTEGRISDYTVKFDFLRNLTPDKRVAPLEINPKTGVKYSLYNAEQLSSDGVIIKSDINFYRKVMKALFESTIDSDTTSALSEYSNVGNMLKNYRKNMITVIANIENFMFPEHVMEVKYHPNSSEIDMANTYTKVTPKNRSNMVGAPLDDVLTNSLRQRFNTNKWLKMFGGFGAGLLGVTVLSQFLFGRGGSGNIKKDKE